METLLAFVGVAHVVRRRGADDFVSRYAGGASVRRYGCGWFVDCIIDAVSSIPKILRNQFNSRKKMG